MKRIWIALALIVIAIAVCIGEHRLTVDMYNELNESLENTKEEIKVKDYSKANEELDYLEESWDKYEKSLSMFISHDILHQTDLSFAKIKSNLKNGANIDVLSEINAVKIQIDGIKETEEVSVKNIL